MSMIAAHPRFNANPPDQAYDAGWWRQTLNKIAAAFFPATMRTLTANGTVTVQDDGVLVDATSAAVTVTLLPASQCQFWKGTVKKIDSSSHHVTLTPTGTDTIDGASSYVLSAQWKAVTVQSNGTGYFVVATV